MTDHRSSPQNKTSKTCAPKYKLNFWFTKSGALRNVLFTAKYIQFFFDLLVSNFKSIFEVPLLDMLAIGNFIVHQ